MTAEWSRRRLLHATASAVGVTALSGCLFGLGSGPPAGSLVITNNRTTGHTATVTATKTSNDSDDYPHHDQTQPPESTPIWTREEQFTVAAGERITQKRFIDEPGAFFLEVQLANGERDSQWVGFYEAHGGWIGGGGDVLYVDIDDHERLYISPSHGD